ncbi:hypothetical protein PV325_011583 [Microctonus aethiopoides]|uniref:Uncharacterized protein n=1 Tax=Microctonus aethiopoides TaxID=144406 RepID=A0AA39FNX2_9HYME|nr:hypothetical protein PV325_011583 [Microctonus aethiopoides]KAK0089377.1 hypothetical protein PV326_004510 [Microctonus aethiopoides]KAK0173115.1 hypothetical protein PV328_006358 [Microctonus aethiopoides]
MILQIILIALIGSAFCQQATSDEIKKAQELMGKFPSPRGYIDYWFPVRSQAFAGLSNAPTESTNALIGYMRVLRRIR